MKFVFGIQRNEGEKTAYDYLFLEEALQKWNKGGYEHPEEGGALEFLEKFKEESEN